MECIVIMPDSNLHDYIDLFSLDDLDKINSIIKLIIRQQKRYKIICRKRRECDAENCKFYQKHFLEVVRAHHYIKRHLLMD